LAARKLQRAANLARHAPFQDAEDAVAAETTASARSSGEESVGYDPQPPSLGEGRGMFRQMSKENKEFVQMEEQPAKFAGQAGIGKGKGVSKYENKELEQVRCKEAVGIEETSSCEAGHIMERTDGQERHFNKVEEAAFEEAAAVEEQLAQQVKQIGIGKGKGGFELGDKKYDQYGAKGGHFVLQVEQSEEAAEQAWVEEAGHIKEQVRCKEAMGIEGTSLFEAVHIQKVANNAHHVHSEEADYMNKTAGQVEIIEAVRVAVVSLQEEIAGQTATQQAGLIIKVEEAAVVGAAAVEAWANEAASFGDAAHALGEVAAEGAADEAPVEEAAAVGVAAGRLLEAEVPPEGAAAERAAEEAAEEAAAATKESERKFDRWYLAKTGRRFLRSGLDALLEREIEDEEDLRVSRGDCMAAATRSKKSGTGVARSKPPQAYGSQV
jgi:hypothetical protein